MSAALVRTWRGGLLAIGLLVLVGGLAIAADQRTQRGGFWSSE